MSVPRPLLETEGTSPEVLELLRSAPRARPLDRAARERSEWRVARLAAVPAAAGAFFWLQHAALAAALGAVITASVVAPRMFSTPSPSVDSKPERAAAPARVPSRAAPSAAPSKPPIEPVTSASPATRKKPPLPEHHDDVVDPLEREAKMLEQARALVSRDPNGALAELFRHEREFGHGALEIERELLIVDALVRLGRRSEAEARGSALRALPPGSFYRARLEQLLGAASR